ncbi:hypothetical protein AB0M43_10045 [Longispora sp. NPDC051575]|uniref:effector-associated constant component EACC1 n=1 Tax=Longispora sp. NPDC051575 TaxID=3154943 RepID=UPI0034362AB7
MVDVLLTVEPDPRFDPDIAHDLALRLRDELAQLDVDSAALATGGPAPVGTKGPDAVTLAAVVVAMSGSGAVLPALVRTAQDWLRRHTARHRIVMTLGDDSIELPAPTPEQQQSLIDAFLRRHE